jgi:hypothetical protein
VHLAPEHGSKKPNHCSLKGFFFTTVSRYKEPPKGAKSENGITDYRFVFGGGEQLQFRREGVRERPNEDINVRD